jgi:hypothetical protein
LSFDYVEFQEQSFEVNKIEVLTSAQEESYGAPQETCQSISTFSLDLPSSSLEGQDLNLVVEEILQQQTPNIDIRVQVDAVFDKLKTIDKLKAEFIRNSNWSRSFKVKLGKEYGMKYSQIYKLHWDW